MFGLISQAGCITLNAEFTRKQHQLRACCILCLTKYMMSASSKAILNHLLTSSLCSISVYDIGAIQTDRVDIERHARCFQHRPYNV